MSISNKIILFLILSMIFVLIGIILYIYLSNASKKKATISPLIIMTAGVFIAAVILFLPVYLEKYFNEGSNVIAIYKSICLSIHNSMRLFVLDGEFDILKDFISENNVPQLLSNIYSIYGVTLFILAPVLVVGVALSFFKNITNMIKYLLSFKTNYYYISELNEKSIILAEDIFNNTNGKKLICFFNVQDEDMETELYFRAKQIKAICFSKELNEFFVKKPSLKRIIKVFFLSTDDNQNLNDGINFVMKYRKNEKYNNPSLQCYVFSQTTNSELLLDNVDKGNIKVRRVNESRNLILGILRNHPIFDNFVQKGDVKAINVLIVGLGKYGTELLKAICWYGQMLGYELTINVIDKGLELEDKIGSIAPEIIKFNKTKIPGEAQYEIYFHEGLSIDDVDFRKTIQKIEDITSVYVMLGDDELNLKCAIQLREEFGRLNILNDKPLPFIYATVANQEKNAIIVNNNGLKNYRGNSYDIELIGNILTEYSLENIEQLELEAKGLKCHLRWSNTSENIIEDTKKYNLFEYYRKSSISEALYSEQRIKLNILLNESKEKDELIKEYEHRRWNAYMRTEGYVYGERRCDIAKTHPSLIPYESLSDHEKKKDEEVLLGSDVD